MMTNAAQREYERIYYADQYTAWRKDTNKKTARRKFERLQVLRGKMRRLGFSEREVVEIEFIAEARLQRAEGE